MDSFTELSYVRCELQGASQWDNVRLSKPRPDIHYQRRLEAHPEDVSCARYWNVIEQSFSTPSSSPKRPSIADRRRQKKANQKARSTNDASIVTTNDASVVKASAVPIASTAADVLKTYQVSWEPWMAYASLPEIAAHAHFYQNLDFEERFYEANTKELRLEHTKNYLSRSVGVARHQ